MSRTHDPAIERIRKVRHEISREVGHDATRLVEYYRELEEQYRDRLMRRGEADDDTAGRSVA